MRCRYEEELKQVRRGMGCRFHASVSKLPQTRAAGGVHSAVCAKRLWRLSRCCARFAVLWGRPCCRRTWASSTRLPRRGRRSRRCRRTATGRSYAACTGQMEHLDTAVVNARTFTWFAFLIVLRMYLFLCAFLLDCTGLPSVGTSGPLPHACAQACPRLRTTWPSGGPCIPLSSACGPPLPWTTRRGYDA